MATHFAWRLNFGHNPRLVIACNERKPIVGFHHVELDPQKVTCKRCRRTMAWREAMTWQEAMEMEKEEKK